MKNIFLLMMFLIGSHSFAEIKNLDAVIRSSSPKERGTPLELLQAIDLTPIKTRKGLFKVKRVSKNSVYERAGIKIGDIVEFGNKAEGLELNSKLEKASQGLDFPFH